MKLGVIVIHSATCLSQFYSQISQHMSSSGFPPKKGLWLDDLSGLPIKGLFFGGKPLELMSWLGSQKSIQNMYFSIQTLFEFCLWKISFVKVMIRTGQKFMKNGTKSHFVHFEKHPNCSTTTNEMAL